MRIIAFIIDHDVVDAILRHLAKAEARSPRGPPIAAALPRRFLSFMSAAAASAGCARGDTFERMRPNLKYTKGNPFKKKNGGAWELAGRLSSVDLTSGLVEGGELTDISVALNWYPNGTSRIELNYIYASPKNQGAANIILLRFQYNPW